MLTAYSRVTVVAPDRIVDLALPNALPLADVLPQVMRYAAPDHDSESTTSWTLARVGGPSLPLSQTLADVGVLDGEVLELRGQRQETRPAVVEDVRDAVEDGVDAAGGVWQTRTTGSFVVLTGAVVFAALAAMVWGRENGLGPSWFGELGSAGAGVAAVLALLAATAWAARFARPLDAQIAAAVAMVWGALLGERFAAAVLDQPPARVLGMALGVAVVAGLARTLTESVTGHVATAAVLAVAGVLHAVSGFVGEPAALTRRILPVLAILVVGVLPRVSLSVGGLASADYRVRNAGRLDLATLRARHRTSNALLLGALIGLALIITWGAIAGFRHGNEWDRTLAVVLGIAAATRSRLFSRTQHMLPLRIAAVTVLVVTAVSAAAGRASLLPWLGAGLALALLVGLGLASMRLSEIPRARVKRTLNLVEFIVVVVLVVVAVGALGVYGIFGGLFT